MSILITDEGFNTAYPINTVLTPDSVPEKVDLSAPQIAILFPKFDDGRGFSIARALRQRGYQGRLRAIGDLIADQYAMARRVGFDEVEISEELAKRQDEAQWQFRSQWKSHDYQTRLGRKPWDGDFALNTPNEFASETKELG